MTEKLCCFLRGSSRAGVLNETQPLSVRLHLNIQAKVIKSLLPYFLMGNFKHTC